MIRNRLAVMVGLVISFVVIIIGEAISHSLNPLPVNVDIRNPEAFLTFVSTAPASFHLMILGNYALACFAGGIVVSAMATDNQIRKALMVGGILMALGWYNLISLSHPTWVVICGLFAFLPFAYLGAKVGIKFFFKRN